MASPNPHPAFLRCPTCLGLTVRWLVRVKGQCACCGFELKETIERRRPAADKLG